MSSTLTKKGKNTGLRDVSQVTCHKLCITRYDSPDSQSQGNNKAPTANLTTSNQPPANPSTKGQVTAKVKSQAKAKVKAKQTKLSSVKLPLALGLARP